MAATTLAPALLAAAGLRCWVKRDSSFPARSGTPFKRRLVGFGKRCG